MNKFKKIIHAIFFPPYPANVITAGLFLAFVAVVLIVGIKGPVAYLSYFLSAYGLFILIATMLIPAVNKGIERLRTIKAVDRYFSDLEFRSRITLYSGTAFNIAYAMFKLISGVVIHSFFFIAIAVYYILLALLKFSLVHTDYKWKLKMDEDTLKKEWKSYQRIGWLMGLMNLALSGIIIQVIWKGNSYNYPGTLIFAMALYAFYRISIVIVSLIRDRKRRTPLFSAAKTLDLAVAVVAMFTLQTAMLNSFNNDSYYTALLNSITGIVVLVVILSISVFMIINARRHTISEEENER